MSDKTRVWVRYVWPYLAVFFVVLVVLSFLLGDLSLLPYLETDIRLQDRLVGPSADLRHWLGTDEIGRDVLAAILDGTLGSILLAFGSIVLAAFLGVFFGFLGAWYGDEMPVKRQHLVVVLWGILSAIYLVAFGPSWLSIGAVVGYMAFVFLVGLILYGLFSRGFRQKTVQIPLDSILMRWYEIFRAIPALLMLIVMVETLEVDTQLKLIPILVFFLWPSFGRFVRGEVMAIRQEPYALAARMMNMPMRRLLWRHVWPVIKNKVLVVAVYASGSVIILEASLGFLGLTGTSDSLGWGELLYAGRQHLHAWWLTVFPGLVVFLFLLMLHSFRRYIHRAERKSL